MSNRIRWGILSTAKIGTVQVIPAMQQGEFCEISALASRNLAQAEQTAAELGIPRAYGSYEELLADPEIDAIYNPLPNHMHVPVTVQAVKAGKHVLCEKPIALNAGRTSGMVASRNRSGSSSGRRSARGLRIFSNRLRRCWTPER